jgi:hypothetical protein
VSVHTLFLPPLKFKLFILFLLLCAHCAVRKRVTLLSFPEGANVSVKSQEGTLKSLGKTPLKYDDRDVESTFGDFAALVFSKEGYEEQHVFVEPSAQLDVKVKLQPKMDDPKLLDTQKRQENLVKQVVQAHAFIHSKKFEEAKVILINVTRDYPYVSVGFDLLGNISYLQKDLQMALQYYEKSMVLNPENPETKLILEKIRPIVQSTKGNQL